MKCGDITIFKMAAVGHLEFSKFNVSPYSCRILCMCTKFGTNRTICCRVMAKTDIIKNGVPPPYWIFEIFSFCSNYSLFLVGFCSWEQTYRRRGGQRQDKGVAADCGRVQWRECCKAVSPAGEEVMADSNRYNGLIKCTKTHLLK